MVGTGQVQLPMSPKIREAEFMSLDIETPQGAPLPAHPTAPAANPEPHQRADADRIAVLSGGGPLPWIMINALIDRYGPVHVIEENKEPTSTLIKRRMKLVGPLSTIGQVTFGIVLKLLHKRSADRKQEIIANAALEPSASDNCRLTHVESVNSKPCRAALRAASPDVVLVVGTRMIRKATLKSVAAPFINYHAGINPKYRGMNGGYWALATGDVDNAGVAIHLVDEGVDTGGIISMTKFEAGPNDNFVTYPVLQAAVGKPLVVDAIEDALRSNLKTMEVDLPSEQWFHPTIWRYVWCGLTKGVW